ncbi:MAG: tetratricopeptide repeat protein [Planctomycetes bacterium]|nr:tetratricopeptide repeat protein [Planctomycetota bacterium]
MSASKCFQKSEMTCVTCHDPHRPHNAGAGCATCHKPASCTAQPRLSQEVRADCVACHMPSRVWTHAHVYHTTDDRYVPLAPRAEHRIGVYPEATEARVLTWLRAQPGAAHRAEAELLAAKVVQFWTNEAARRLTEGRFKAAIGSYREALRVVPSAAVRERLAVAVARQSEFDALNDRLRAAPSAEVATGVLEDMLRLNPRSALAHGELGTVLARTGQRERAVGHLRAVAEYEPGDSYGVVRLAEMAHFEGRTDEAATLCAEALRVNPASAQSRHLFGMVLSRQARWAAAEEQFRKALAIDPAHVGSNDRLSEALRRQGHTDEAIRFARRAAHFSQNRDPEVLLTLGNAYIAARRTPEARAALEKALAVAPRDQRGLVEAIRDRLRALD